MPDNLHSKYETVIGLEVHARLQTNTKLFSGDANNFGSQPNENISAITLAHPGTLPKTNKKAIEYAVKAGIAFKCSINKLNYFARKHYFYPDLPKGFQTSQHTAPICVGGYVIVTVNNQERKLRLHHIHLEEDAGKSIHDQHDDYSLVDYNRAGTPLIEMVTEPDMRSADEAAAFLNELRKLVRWIEVCDGNMEEGSLRCDANVSVRLHGETKLGTRVEIKNLNSIRNVKKAIEFEAERLMMLMENNEIIQQQTRSFDATTDTTFAIREKEEANDYRYFPEPDLPPVFISDEYVNDIKQQMPSLPHVLYDHYINELQLSAYDAGILVADKETADFYNRFIQHTKHYKAAFNWLSGPLKQAVNENSLVLNNDFNFKELAALIQMVEDNEVSFSAASSKIFPVLLQQKDATAKAVAADLNLIQTNNTAEIDEWINNVLNKMPDKISEYKKGKKGLLGLFVGEVKKISKGKADPKIVTALLQEKLNN